MAARVTAPAVQVKVGTRVHQVSRGSLLPEDVEKADLDRLAAKGMVVIEDADVDESQQSTAEPVAPEKPQARKPAAK